MSESILIVVAIIVGDHRRGDHGPGPGDLRARGLPGPHSRLQGHHRRSRPSDRRHRRGGLQRWPRSSRPCADREKPGSWGQRTSASIGAETVGGGRQGRTAAARSTYRSSLTATTHRANGPVRGSRGRETLARLRNAELLGQGHPGPVQELVERRIHDVGDRVPAVLQHLHALLRAWPHVGVQRHLLLPLTQGQRATGSVGRAAVGSIPSRIGHARILHA